MITDTIRTVEFKQRLRGYYIDDVDAFLEKVAGEVEAGRPVRSLCASAMFRQALRGYDIGDVDQFLSQVAAEDPFYQSKWAIPPSDPLPSMTPQTGSKRQARRRRRQW